MLRPCPARIASALGGAMAVLLLATACSTVTSTAPQPAPAESPRPGPTPDLLWVGDAESGDLTQFQDTPWNDVGGTHPEAVQDVVRAGGYAIRLGISGTTTSRDGICCGSRNELVPLFRELREGDDLYFGFSTYLAAGFPVESEWQVITQFKQNFDGSPPLSLNVEAGQYRIEGGFGHPDGPDPFNVAVGPADTGVWVDWVLHVLFSADPAVGFVEVWKDGGLVLPRYAPTSGTMYPGDGERAGGYVKTGYYRNPEIAIPGTIYLDEWRIGTTQNSVTP